MADVQIPGTSPLVRHPEKESLLPTATRAVDIGCGTGRQTAVLASEPGVSVTAVDLLPEMVEGMKERMEYFDSVFPGMKSAAENVLVMQECGCLHHGAAGGQPSYTAVAVLKRMYPFEPYMKKMPQPSEYHAAILSMFRAYACISSSPS